jgi:hypothetical protein
VMIFVRVVGRDWSQVGKAGIQRSLNLLLALGVCVCVCVCVGEREEGEGFRMICGMCIYIYVCVCVCDDLCESGGAGLVTGGQGGHPTLLKLVVGPVCVYVCVCVRDREGVCW